MSSRYDSNPFLRLLECYVLLSIGELSDKDKVILENMTPKLQQIYSKSGTWDEIVASVMQFSNNDIKEEIRQTWQKCQQIAQKNEESILPEEFAQIFVDTNFNP